MRAIGERIGLYRVAAILIAGALALEIVRVRLVDGGEAATIACTFGEVALLAAAVAVFFAARRAPSSSGSRGSGNNS